MRKFARREIAPLVREMDESQVTSSALVKKLFDQGFQGIEVAQDYGGVGASFSSSILLIEEISAVDPAVGTFGRRSEHLDRTPVLRWRNEGQKNKYLPRIVSDLVCPMH